MGKLCDEIYAFIKMVDTYMNLTPFPIKLVPLKGQNPKPRFLPWVEEKVLRDEITTMFKPLAEKLGRNHFLTGSLWCFIDDLKNEDDITDRLKGAWHDNKIELLEFSDNPKATMLKSVDEKILSEQIAGFINAVEDFISSTQASQKRENNNKLSILTGPLTKGLGFYGFKTSNMWAFIIDLQSNEYDIELLTPVWHELKSTLREFSDKPKVTTQQNESRGNVNQPAPAGQPRASATVAASSTDVLPKKTKGEPVKIPVPPGHCIGELAENGFRIFYQGGDPIFVPLRPKLFKILEKAITFSHIEAKNREVYVKNFRLKFTHDMISLKKSLKDPKKNNQQNRSEKIPPNESLEDPKKDNTKKNNRQSLSELRNTIVFPNGKGLIEEFPKDEKWESTIDFRQERSKDPDLDLLLIAPPTQSKKNPSDDSFSDSNCSGFDANTATRIVPSIYVPTNEIKDQLRNNRLDSPESD